MPGCSEQVVELRLHLTRGSSLVTMHTCDPRVFRKSSSSHLFAGSDSGRTISFSNLEPVPIWVCLLDSAVKRRESNDDSVDKTFERKYKNLNFAA